MEKTTWNAKVSFPGFGTTGTTAAVGNDSRLSDARTPTAHNQAWSTITTTPTTLSGYGITDAQGSDADLTALAGLSANGLIARTGSGTAAVRTITGTANQVIVTNGDGASGNPTLSLPQSIATTSSPTFAGLSLGAVAVTPGNYVQKTGDTMSGTLANTTLEGFRLRNDNGYIAFFSDDQSTRVGYLQGVKDTGMRLAADINSSLQFWTNGSMKVIIDTSGNVGIGTIMPTSPLYIKRAAPAIIVESTGTYDTADLRLLPAVSGAVGTWNNTPLVLRTNNVDRLTISAAGALRLNSYGAGSLVTDSSGNVTASSDAHLKTVTGSFTRGLSDVLKLTPRTYRWNVKSGMNTDDENVGFIAQEVLEAIPEAVGQYRTSEVEVDGKKTKKREKAELLTLSDRPLIAALVNAVKELKSENDELRKRLDKLETKK